MKMDANVRVGKLVDQYPFLLETLTAYSDKFSMLSNPLMRKTIGQFATLGKAAQMGGVGLADLLDTLAAAIRENTGESVEVDASAVAVPTSPDLDPARLEKLKTIIKGLHQGKGVDEVKQEFAELIQNVGPGEIAAMEQQLVAEGLPPDEIKRLCDVHVAVFRQSLDQAAPLDAPPGHPVHTFRKENAALGEVVAIIRQLLSEQEKASADVLAGEFARLAEIEKHYLRKENQLFPHMEKYGVTAPPQVMWAIHDDIRAQLKQIRAALPESGIGGIRAQADELLTAIEDMIYKEENILFPMCMQLFGAQDWAEVYRGEADLGYALVEPELGWLPPETAAEGASSDRPAGMKALPLDTGLLTLEQVNLMLTHLPVDLSFVDEHDTVRYYSEGPERVFPRSPGVIGREVHNCHPPKSLDMVNRILESFRAGTKDVAEFWLEMEGKFIHVRYYALRSVNGEYKGCLEVSQDVTAIRALEGQKRLLDWE